MSGDDDTGDSGRKRDRWHVGKEVPLAFVVAFLVQLAGFVWYASSITKQVDINTPLVADTAQQLRNEQLKSTRLRAEFDELKRRVGSSEEAMHQHQRDDQEWLRTGKR